MSQIIGKDSSTAGSLFLRSTATVSLHERFSQVQVAQQTRSRTSRPPFGGARLQQRRVRGSSEVLLLSRGAESSLLNPQTCDSCPCLRRRSVWTRLGGRQVTCRVSTSRFRGFWSFRNKYKWRTGFSSTYQGRGDLRSRLVRRRLLMKRNIQKLTAGPTHLRRGGASASRGRSLSEGIVPTRRQLDAQLDEYMSMSKSRLDAQLDEYMSMSKSRLDAQLDEYMAMAGQTTTPAFWLTDGAAV